MAGTYDEQTVMLNDGGTLHEIYGMDGYGWYGTAKDLEQYVSDLRRDRREAASRGDDVDALPIPFKLGRKRKNTRFRDILKPDGSMMTKDWLLTNGCISEDD